MVLNFITLYLLTILSFFARILCSRGLWQFRRGYNWLHSTSTKRVTFRCVFDLQEMRFCNYGCSLYKPLNLEHGIISWNWHHEATVLLFKQHKLHRQLDSYRLRLISLTWVLCETRERMVNCRLQTILTPENLLLTEQADFQPSRSIEK